MKFLLCCVLFSTALFSHALYSEEHPRAWDLAVQALMHNIVAVEGGLPEERDIVLAGANQFRTAWSWDFAFASKGIMAIGQCDSAR
jgi:hypothetical protein